MALGTAMPERDVRAEGDDVPIRAVVLDFDGVVSNSMPQHAEAYRRVLGPYDVRPSDHEIFLREGARSESIIRALLEEAGHEVDEETVSRTADEKQEAFKALGDPDLYEGARPMVHAIRALAPRLALVTGTRRENLDRLIPDLLDEFDEVLAQDAYSQDKPHPEPYARAAERLGVPAETCVAVENAPRGVKSARAAGYAMVIGIATTLPGEDLVAAGADVVAEDHEAVVRLVKERLGA